MMRTVRRRRPPLTVQVSHVRIKLGELIDAVADVFEMPQAYIVGRRRYPDIALARAVLMYLAGERYGFGLSATGRALGVHHTTVLAARRKMAARMESDPDLRDLVCRVAALLELNLEDARSIA